MKVEINKTGGYPLTSFGNYSYQLFRVSEKKDFFKDKNAAITMVYILLALSLEECKNNDWKYRKLIYIKGNRDQ